MPLTAYLNHMNAPDDRGLDFACWVSTLAWHHHLYLSVEDLNALAMMQRAALGEAV